MEEKKYLKWYNKVGYGSGDIAGNVVFAFLSSFIMIYLTNTVGLNAGVIGSLIAASKVLDGISDVVFGSMIDRTHTKMGKARPWMLGAYFGCAITLIAAFSVPTTMGKTYVCPHCDENKYRFETYTKREKNRYVNPIVNAMKDRKQ